MQKFRSYSSRRLLNAWLAAFILQSGRLFSQIEATAGYPDEDQTFQSEQWPIEENRQWRSQEDALEEKKSPDLNPSQEGHWPVYSRNEWDDAPITFEQQPLVQSETENPSSDFSYPPFLPTENPWADRENISYFNQTTDQSQISVQESPKHNSQAVGSFPEHGDFLPHLEIQTSEPDHTANNNAEEGAAHTNASQLSDPLTAHQNLDIEVPNNLFQDTETKKTPTPNHQNTPKTPSKTIPQNISSLPQEEKNEPFSLIDGKGNAKVVKKQSEAIFHNPGERLEEALHQTEEIIGKVNFHGHEIGMADEPGQIAVPFKQTSQLHSDTISNEQSKHTKENSRLNKQEIAQTTVPSPFVQPGQPFVNGAAVKAQQAAPQAPKDKRKEAQEISINFNNVSMIEYIRFISRLSNKNFIFDDEDLQFNVTIISEEPTTIENLMAALLQELRIRDLSLMEQGNNILIHRNPRVRSPARIISDENRMIGTQDSEIITRVFRLNTLDPVKASEIIRPLLSEDSLIEVLKDSNNLIITDLVVNVNKISQLISTLDAPNSGVTIGQYVVRNGFVDSLVDLAGKLLQPIAQGNPFVLVPHSVTNSIYIVSNSFLVEKALAILQNLDLNEGQTKILSLETLQPSYDTLHPNSPEGAFQRWQQEGGYAPGFGGGRFGTGGGSLDFEGGFGPGTYMGGGQGPRPGQTAQPQTPDGVTPGGIGAAGQLPPIGGFPQSFPLGGVGTEGDIVPYPYGQQPPLGGVGTEGNISPYPYYYGQQAPLGGVGTEGRISPPPQMGFTPGVIGTEGRSSAIFNEAKTFAPGGIGSASRWTRDLPVGHIERTMFFIYKLRYRKGDNIEIALRKIANSLQLTGTANADLISAINSSQWIESSNALIFTGTPGSLEKVRELILEIDVPLRQVFIEMLILLTTVKDSLSYSVDWINRFGGGSTTGEQGFLEATPGSGIAAADNFLTGSQTIFSGGTVVPPAAASPLPVATGFLNSGGFAAGVIGTHLTHNGTVFSSIGALVRAIHSDGKAEILLNPKIVTEDNNPAEIFVGGTDRYKTQSITNDLGSLVTNNFQFIDVGTTVRVTPLIGNNGIITLEILQETTNEAPDANTGGNNQNVNLVQVLTKTRTVTKVHVPNGFFVVISGMIRDTQARTYSRIPCLGGIPLVGCFGKTQTNANDKANLMLFIRPFIIDNEDDYEEVTKRQQDIFREKCKFRRSWNYEVDEGLSFANIRPLDPDDMDCSCNERQQP